MHVLMHTLPGNTCIYCMKAKEFLADLNIPFDEVILETKEDRAAIKERTGMKTAPVIFVDGHLIGGYTELVEHLKSGSVVVQYR